MDIALFQSHNASRRTSHDVIRITNHGIVLFFKAMVTVQMLSELEEIIQYKLIPERRESIKRTWWNRLQGCQRVVEDWQKILQVRSLVLTPQEDMQSWLKYSSLCRKSGRLALSHKTLVMLLGSDPSKHADQPLPTTYPQVTFAYMKHMWREGQKVRMNVRVMVVG